jgi:hypothetical protein
MQSQARLSSFNTDDELFSHFIVSQISLFKIYCLNSSSEKLQDFIENNLFFIDINPKMLNQTKENINKL